MLCVVMYAVVCLVAEGRGSYVSISLHLVCSGQSSLTRVNWPADQNVICPYKAFTRILFLT